MKKSIRFLLLSAISLSIISLVSCASTPKQQKPEITEQENNSALPEATDEEPSQQDTEKNDEGDVELIDSDEALFTIEPEEYFELTETEDREPFLGNDEPSILESEDPVSKQIEESVENLQDDAPTVIEDENIISENTPEEAAAEASSEKEKVIQETKAPEIIAETTAEEVKEVQPAKPSAKTNSQNAEDKVKAQDAAAEETAMIEDTTAETVEAELPEEKPAEIPETITPSRSVTLKNNQYLDVSYPGSGWIYLGEVYNTNMIRYMGRKIGEKDTVFSLRTKEEGTAVLHFYRNDPVTLKAIDDYLEVKVSGKNLTTDHVEAPLYSQVKSSNEASGAISSSDNGPTTTVPEESSYENTVSSSITYKSSSHTDSDASSKEGQTVVEDAPSSASVEATVTQDNTAAAETVSTEGLSSDEILKLAKSSYEKKEYEDALKYLNEFFDKALVKLDEGYYLQGEILESVSSVRDIKKALEAYQKIVSDYPQSVLWQKANEKVTYLKRFYFNIR